MKKDIDLTGNKTPHEKETYKRFNAKEQER